jgi:MoaA/NifB/PqqE/SkfB family radical SAM enzyme
MSFTDTLCANEGGFWKCLKGAKEPNSNVKSSLRVALTTVNVREIVKRYLAGCRKTAVFALTTQCNCRCVMCDIYEKPPEFISLRDAKKILDFLAANKFLIVYFTGGEPTLHPDVVEVVKYANSLGFATSMTTNGTCSKEMVMKLKEAGLYLLSVSLDHWDADLCEKLRRHKDIKRKQEETIKNCKEASLKTYALTFLNSYVIRDGIENMIEYVNKQLGVPIGFCYPMKNNADAYPLGGKLPEESILYQNLQKTIETILFLKRNGGAIANLGTCIEDIIRFHEKKPPHVYCKGGEDVVFIDCRGDVYPCFVKEKLFNALHDKEPRFLKNVKCNECLATCFREPSILAQSIFNPVLIKEGFYSFSTRSLFM